MNARDELAKIIQREYGRAIARQRLGDCYDAPADAILAVGYRKPRTITTHEDLAKEQMIVVRSEAGTISNIVDGKAYFFGFERHVPISALAMPVTVLWGRDEAMA